MSREREPNQLYCDDLAQIHVDGYGFHWSGAADAILEWFSCAGIKAGHVVDLGCGGGQWLRRLTDEGFEATGVDVSSSMVRIARRNAPGANLMCGSFADVQLPPCDAVTSLGEPLNYLGSSVKMRRTMRNVYGALRTGGLFVFDVRRPAHRAVPPRDHFKSAADWFCHARIEEYHKDGRLTRFITTFRRSTDDSYRRHDEVHRLRTFPNATVAGWLRDLGFRVKTRRDYGVYRLGPRQSVFVCRKP